MDRKEILEEAEKLLMQQNIYNLDLGLLARHCGIGKAKLYAIFENKRNLLFLLLAHICQKEKENIGIRLSQKTGSEVLKCFFDEYFSILEKVPYYTIQNLVKQSWESKKEIDGFNQWIEHTYQNILMEMKKGSESFSTEESRVLAKMLSVQMNHYYSNLREINLSGKTRLWKNQIIKCFSL